MNFIFKPVASVTLAVNLRLAIEALGTIDRFHNDVRYLMKMRWDIGNENTNVLN